MESKTIRTLGLSFVFLAAFVLAVSFVSADAAAGVQSFMSSIASILRAVFDGIKPITDLLFGSQILNVNIADGSTFALTEILFLIIVFALVYTIIDSIDFLSEHGWVVTLLSAAVAVLSVRFLSDGMLSALLLPYQALGIALSAALPFIIYFIFVEVKLKTNTFVRKLLWIFLGVIYVFIYIFRFDKLGTYSWIYLVTFLVAVLMCFVDGTIQGWLARGRVERVHADAKERLVNQYNRDLWQVNDDFSKSIITRAQWEKKIKDIKKKIEAVAKS